MISQDTSFLDPNGRITVPIRRANSQYSTIIQKHKRVPFPASVFRDIEWTGTFREISGAGITNGDFHAGQLPVMATFFICLITDHGLPAWQFEQIRRTHISGIRDIIHQSLVSFRRVPTHGNIPIVRQRRSYRIWFEITVIIVFDDQNNVIAEYLSHRHTITMVLPK